MFSGGEKTLSALSIGSGICKTLRSFAQRFPKIICSNNKNFWVLVRGNLSEKKRYFLKKVTVFLSSDFEIYYEFFP